MPDTPEWTDPYLWPAEDGVHSDVLRNRYGLRDPEQLALREYRETALRSIEIKQGRADIPATGDAAEWCAIHRHLFSNVYDWAGQFRTVRLFKGENFEFASPSMLEDYLTEVSAEIRETDWSALNLNQFIDRAARTHMLLNFAHPFREGNGRSEKLFLDRQISSARYELDYSQVDMKDWNWAGMWSRDTGGRKPTRPPRAARNLPAHHGPAHRPRRARGARSHQPPGPRHHPRQYPHANNRCAHR
ncbi:Fic/DOC family protein [Nocardia abscessus]|uniref:Fic/DOC family protein n=1 Tax=Nocardia abscessus TaxID=120957 RepID=UPI0024568938|nr:Fic family protein [Nocardia abscessus]